MTGLDHQTTDAVEEAARWYAALSASERGARPAVPMLKERFGLSALEACQAIAQAAEIRAGRV